MQSNTRFELREHILPDCFWKKGFVVNGQRAVVLSDVNVFYPADPNALKTCLQPTWQSRLHCSAGLYNFPRKPYREQAGGQITTGHSRQNRQHQHQQPSLIGEAFKKELTPNIGVLSIM
jgi:hypothetical protein